MDNQNICILCEIILLLVIAYIVIVVIHELTHFAIYRATKHNVLIVKLCFLCFAFGKIKIEFSLPSSFVFVDCSDIDCIGKEELFITNFKINILVTYLEHIAEMVICIFIAILFPNEITVILAIVVSIISIMIFGGAIYNDDGDLHQFHNLKKQKNYIYDFIAACEITNGFKNNYLFMKVKKLLLQQEKLSASDDVLLNYFIDYSIFHDLEIDNWLFEKYTSFDHSNVNCKRYILEKLILYRCIKSQIVGIKDQNFAQLKFLNKLFQGKEIAINEIELTPMHKLFCCNKNYHDYCEKVFEELKKLNPVI